MPYDGSGNYVPPSAPTFPAISGTAISSTYYNAVINDIALALNNVITRDGQGHPTAAISWNGQNLTGVAALGVTGAITAGSMSLTTELGVGSGGTGVDASAAANGQVLIGNGTGFSLANLTGDSNITVVNSAGGIQLTFTGGGGSVSSVQASGGTTGLSFSGGPITTSGTLTLAGTLDLDNGGTGATTAADARTNLGVPSLTGTGASGSWGISITGSAASATTATSATSATSAGSVTNACTFNNGGAGAASGTTYNGGAARTISYNTIGAQPAVPSVQSAASGALTPDGDADDICIRTGLSAGLTINAPSGSPTQGRGMVIRLKDNGTARALTWNAIYRGVGVTLPTTTVINKTVYIGLIYNSTDTKWDAVSVAQEA